MTFTSLRPFTYTQKFKNSFNLLYSLLLDSTFDYSHDVYCVNKSVLQGICINNIAWTAIFNFIIMHTKQPPFNCSTDTELHIFLPQPLDPDPSSQKLHLLSHLYMLGCLQAGGPHLHSQADCRCRCALVQKGDMAYIQFTRRVCFGCMQTEFQ